MSLIQWFKGTPTNKLYTISDVPDATKLTGPLPVSIVATGTAATDLGKTEDAAHASGDTGVMLLAVRNDSGATTLADATGDYTPLSANLKGALISAIASATAVADGSLSVGAFDSSGNNSRNLGVALVAFNGTTWDRLRTPSVFKVVALTAATAETTIWTPAAGKKFRLMGFLLTCGAASTLTFKDNTAGTTIFAARGATDTPISPNGLGNGYISAAANNVLTVTRGTSATLDGVVWGVEE